MRIQHIALAEQWATAQTAGTYTVSTLGLTLDDVGFIHCSRAEQLEDVYRHVYADVSDPLVLLTIDTDRLTSPWQYDDVPGEALSFPHIYGPLNVDAVVSAEPLRSSASS